MRNDSALPIRALMQTLRRLGLIDDWEVGANLYKYWLKKKREQETDPI